MLELDDSQQQAAPPPLPPLPPSDWLTLSCPRLMLERNISQIEFPPSDEPDLKLVKYINQRHLSLSAQEKIVFTRWIVELLTDWFSE